MKQILVVSLLALVALVSCNKPDEDLIQRIYVKDNDELVCNQLIEILTDWTFKIGDTQILRHTPGLESMALSGSHATLNGEWCNLNSSGKKIPTNLGDDIYDAGYASQRVYFDYIIAMYHPLKGADDHFITYNWKDGSWTHWKLGNRPTIIKNGN